MPKRPYPRQLSYEDIKNSLERHTSHEAGKQLLVNMMTTGEVAVTWAKLSLQCKLSGGRIEVPVRSVNCGSHFECFDLRNYLDCEAKNSATINAPSTKSRSKRPLWTCPVCGGKARAEDLRVDDYFAHILQSVPDSVDEVQLLPDGSFEEVSGTVPDVSIDDEEPFEPQPQQLRDHPSGPGHALDELLKQSKAFQLTLQNGEKRTKKDLLDSMESFLEKERDALNAMLKKLTSANQARQLNALNVLITAFRPTLQLVR